MYGYKHYRFSLSIDRDTLLSVYQGTFKRIRVRTDGGMVVDLDAGHLKEFTSEDGIHGIFELLTTQENKFVKIVKLK